MDIVVTGGCILNLWFLSVMDIVVTGGCVLDLWFLPVMDIIVTGGCVLDLWSLSVSSNFLYQSQCLMFVSCLLLIAAASSLIYGCLLEFDGAF